MRQSEPGQFKYSRLDAGLCLFFILFWIIPLFVTNLTKKKIPFFPKFFSALTSTSNLFTQANYIWPMPYIQVLPRGSSTWITLSEDNYFQMQTFGYRTRLFEALYLAVDDPQKSLSVQKELARWVAQEYESRNGGLQLSSVRFVAGLNTAEPGAKFHGHWEKPPFESFDPPKTYEISRHDMSDGKR